MVGPWFIQWAVEGVNREAGEWSKPTPLRSLAVGYAPREKKFQQVKPEQSPLQKGRSIEESQGVTNFFSL